MKKHLIWNVILAGCAAASLASVGCTCSPAESGGAGPARGLGRNESRGPDDEVTIEPASAGGAWPVTLVLDPSGVLCKRAIESAAGRRHVLCDRTKEDLSAASLRRALQDLKANQGAAVVSTDAWLVAAPGRAAVARSLAMREPAFFSRVAAWVGQSPVTAGLFGPTFLGAVGGGGFRALALVGPGAEQANAWAEIARRSGIQLTLWRDRTAEDALWSGLAEALASEPTPMGASSTTEPVGSDGAARAPMK